MFGMALTRPRHWQCIDEWRGRLRARVRTKDGHFEQLLWQYSAIWQETFQFLSNVSRYLDCFFWKLPQFHTSNFRKIVRQHSGKYYMSFAGNLLIFPAVKEFWKSVKNWQSYSHEISVQFFWATMHISQIFMDTFPVKTQHVFAVLKFWCYNASLCLSVKQ